MMHQPFTVCMAVYRNDNPRYIMQSIESITIRQTIRPSEIVLVVDGPVSKAIETVIKQQTELFPPLRIIWLAENKGLGNALRIGVEAASNEIIARMDSDDIALPDRFEKQLEYFEANPDCDIVGGQISEFIDSEDNVVGKRSVPLLNDEIYTWMKKRCPFNHMTVMFRKTKILSVGNYIDWHYNEDYYLWIRMAESDCKFANLPDILVDVRVGEDMYARRGGWRYFKSEARLQNYMFRHHIISLPRRLYNIAGRFLIQVVMPNKLRGFIFRKLFRK